MDINFFASLGDSLNPLIGFIGVYLIYQTWRTTKEELKATKEELESQKQINEIYSTFNLILKLEEIPNDINKKRVQFIQARLIQLINSLQESDKNQNILQIMSFLNQDEPLTT